jgi:hypothetical protein
MVAVRTARRTRDDKTMPTVVAAMQATARVL